MGAVVTSLLKSKREKTKLETLIFLRDTMIGRPAQNVQLSGSMMHAHTVWRPLSSLKDDEIALLDKLTRKLSAPTSDASQNGPQNQIESKPAIEAEIVDPKRPSKRRIALGAGTGGCFRVAQPPLGDE